MGWPLTMTSENSAFRAERLVCSVAAAPLIGPLVTQRPRLHHDGKCSVDPSAVT